MKLTLVFLLLYVALPPSGSFKSSGNSPQKDESSLSPDVSKESSPSPGVLDESSLSFEWTGPRSLRVTTRDGDEDDIKLRPALGIGGVQEDCLYTGYFVKDLGSSAGVVGCQSSVETQIVIVSNYSKGTMFILINENKKTLELMESSIDADYGQDDLERSKRSTYYDEYEEEYVDDDYAYDGEPIPENLYYKFQLAYDDSMLTKMNENKRATETYVRSVATLAQTYFKKSSLGTNIHFDVNQKIKYLKGKKFHIDRNTDPGEKSTIKDATAIKNSQPLIIFTFTDDSEFWRGVAPKRQACSPTRARAIVKHRKQYQRAAMTMAHEMGHLYGNHHDGSKWELPACIGKGIMTNNATNRPEEWSACSKDRLVTFYNNPKFNASTCLKTAPPCDNTAWSGPCICGVGVTNLCTSEDEGYCQSSTATCMVMETKLKTCQSFPSTPGDLLESGCEQPQDLENGLFICLREGFTCVIHCDPGFKLNTSIPHNYIECIDKRWTQMPSSFGCIPDCDYRRMSHPDCNDGKMLNPVVLLTGGWGVENSVEVFSPWQSGDCNKDLEDIPDKRNYHSLHFFRGKVIMCGGRNTKKSCLYLDQNQRFVPHNLLIGSRYAHTGAVVKDKLLLMGGNYYNLMESWDGSQWVQEVNFDQINDLKYYSCAASINEDTILMAGGWNNIKWTNKMLKYRNGVWERMEDFPGPGRSTHGCAFIQTPEGDAFLIAGGWDGSLYLRSSYLYNIEKREWEEVGQLATDRYAGQILVVGGRVIMLGGSGELVEVEEFNVETKTWATIVQKIKRGRRYFGAVIVPGDLVGC